MESLGGPTFHAPANKTRLFKFYAESEHLMQRAVIQVREDALVIVPEGEPSRMMINQVAALDVLSFAAKGCTRTVVSDKRKRI